MNEFKVLSLADKPLIEKYLNQSTIRSYEYSFAALYLWRKVCCIEYAIIENVLVLKKTEEGKGTFFMTPIGYTPEQLPILVEHLQAISFTFDDSPYLFGDCECSFLEDLKKHTAFTITTVSDTNTSEYLYLTQDLLDLKGNKYHRKKNHCNSFQKNYTYSVAPILHYSQIEECLLLLEKWQENKIIKGRELSMEREAIFDLLLHQNQLAITSMGLYVNQQLVGFTMGECFPSNTAVIHIEKADISYKGIYSFLSHCFLAENFSHTTYVNRQEDCGDAGLRKAKESYYPIEKLSKCFLTLEPIYHTK